jgi:O-antigen ligase
MTTTPFAADYPASTTSGRLWKAGQLALLAFSLFWLLAIEVSQFAQGVLIGLTLVLLVRREGRGLRADPLFWVVMGFFGYQLLLLPKYTLEFPELIDKQLEYTLHYAKIALIPVVAWWLGGSPRRVTMTLALAVAGFLLGVTFQDGGFIDSFAAIKAHQRVGLGYKNWEHVSIYAAFSLLVLLIFGHRILELFGRYRAVGLLIVSLSAVYCLIIIIAVQTRATWLGLLVAGCVGVALRYLILRPRGQPESGNGKVRLVSAIGVGLALLLAGSALDLGEMINKRLAQERQVFETIMSGDLKDVPLTSVGIRVRIWLQATEWIAERPLIGWGPKARETLFENGELPSVIAQRFGVHHFHNQFLELAVAYGLIGVAFFVAITAIVGMRGWRAWKDGRMPDEVMLFGVTFFVYWQLVNGAESYFNYSTGEYLNAIVAGAFYTFVHRRSAGASTGE